MTDPSHHLPRRSRRDRPQLRRLRDQDGRIVLLDCGLMFPDTDMLGVDLVLPGLHLAARTGRRHRRRASLTHGHEDHVGAPVVPAPRGRGPALRLRAHPRPGPWPDRGGRAAQAHRAQRRRRRRAAGHRSVRVRVPPGHPLGAPRVRHRVPHAAGNDPAHRRLQARPDAGRRPARPTSPASAAMASGEGIRLLLSDSTNADQHGHAALGDVRRRGALRPHARARGPSGHHGVLRQPHPPHPADRRRRHRRSAA